MVSVNRELIHVVRGDGGPYPPPLQVQIMGDRLRIRVEHCHGARDGAANTLRRLAKAQEGFSVAGILGESAHQALPHSIVVCRSVFRCRAITAAAAFRNVQ
jgi:hypothetical protein